MMVYIIGSKIEEVNWLVASGYNDSIVIPICRL